MTEKLKVTKTTYKLNWALHITGLNVHREPESSESATIEDRVGAESSVAGTRVTLTETGAKINGTPLLVMSPRRRSGGCLLNDYTSINIRPIEGE